MNWRATFILLGVVLAVAVATGIGYCVYPAVVSTIQGNAYYTYADLKKAKDDAYYEGCKSQEELISQVEYYKNQADSSAVGKQNMQNQIDTLTRANNEQQAQIESLENDRTASRNQIAELRNEVEILNRQNDALRDSISYYENYIGSVENETSCVAVFEVAGVVKQADIVAKNSVVVFPTITVDDCIFAGWLVDDVAVNSDSYHISQNTRFVADLRHTVHFVDDGEIIDTQLVRLEHCVDTSLVISEKNGRRIAGWTFDGINKIDVEHYLINEDTVFYALYESDSVWETVFDTPSTLNFDTANVKTVYVPELTAGDTFRVTFSRVSYVDEQDQAEPVYYYTGDKWKFNVPELAQALTVTSDEEFSMRATLGSRPIMNITISVDCLADGVLTISFVCVDDSENVLTNWLDVNSKTLVIDSIEIQRCF